jgi:hypothetical protein
LAYCLGVLDKLRYRLMPYIYSLAWKVASDDYTIQRPLVMDWRTDPRTWNAARSSSESTGAPTALSICMKTPATATIMKGVKDLGLCRSAESAAEKHPPHCETHG